MPVKKGSKRESKKRSYKTKRSVKKRSYKPRKSLKRSVKKRSYKPRKSLKRRKSVNKTAKWGSGVPVATKQIVNKLMSISKLDPDYKSLARIANLIKSGKISAAYSLARDQDTFVREMIPNNAWRYMETH